MKHIPRKRFGQNFLTDADIIRSLVEAIRPQPDDIMVEIGPGLGAMTQPLLQRLNHLHTVELDRDIVAQSGHHGRERPPGRSPASSTSPCRSPRSRRATCSAAPPADGTPDAAAAEESSAKGEEMHCVRVLNFANAGLVGPSGDPSRTVRER